MGWSSLLGFGAPPLPWLSCLELGLGAFLSFCHLRWRGHFYASALFLASASFHRCLASILSMVPLAYLLVVLAFPAFSIYISLWHLCPLPWSSSLVLRFCTRVLVRVFRSLRAASSVTTPGPPLASAVSVFLFPSFVTRSNLSILRDGVLPLG